MSSGKQRHFSQFSQMLSTTRIIDWEKWLNTQLSSATRRRHKSHQGDLLPFQSRLQSAIDSLEAVLSSEGRIYCGEMSENQPNSCTLTTTLSLIHSPFRWSLRSRLVFFFLASSCSSRDNSFSCSSPEQFMKSFHFWKNRTTKKLVRLKPNNYFNECLKICYHDWITDGSIALMSLAFVKNLKHEKSCRVLPFFLSKHSEIAKARSRFF